MASFTKLATCFISLFMLIFEISCSKSFFDFSAIDINGRKVEFNIYKGKVVLVVNVASECGFTDSHYTALVKARKVYGAEGHFEILAFPCNQFGAQEPGTNAAIAKFAKDTYKVNFPMFSKINVIGEDVPDYWQYLVDETRTAPNWNFWKYLVDHTGKVVKAYPPQKAVEDVIPDVAAKIKVVKEQKASIDKIKEALAQAQKKMGQKSGGLKFQVHDDL